MHTPSEYSLHIPVQKLEEKLGERTRIIEADISQTFDFSNERSRRSTEKHSDKYKYSTAVCYLLDRTYF
jgi:hypothetical protein